MTRKTSFVSYRPKTVLNKSKRPDHWFWTRYSVYPYIGCQHGCEFCYCRERKYSPYENPDDFAYVIKAKENAPDLLRRGFRHLPVDLVFTGDYQPAERKFQLSRRILEVCLESGFPVFVLERSPLVLRDIDLLRATNERARAVVAFSILATPGSPSYPRVRQMERLAPPAEKRYAAMQEFAAAGILTGTCFMPVLPGLCDDDKNLENVVRWTAEHGGKFVLVGGLTLSDQQRTYFFKVLEERFPDLIESYQRLYPLGSYASPSWGGHQVGLRVKELCQQYGISDRIPRPIIPGDKRTLNKRIVETLANECYWMELRGESSHRVWAYRKAAWAIEDTEQDINLIYKTMGFKGLESIENVGPRLAAVVENLLKGWANPSV
jgi:DNA repair photolyase